MFSLYTVKGALCNNFYQLTCITHICFSHMWTGCSMLWKITPLSCPHKPVMICLRCLTEDFFVNSRHESLEVETAGESYRHPAQQRCPTEPLQMSRCPCQELFMGTFFFDLPQQWNDLSAYKWCICICVCVCVCVCIYIYILYIYIYIHTHTHSKKSIWILARKLSCSQQWVQAVVTQKDLSCEKNYTTVKYVDHFMY